MGETVWGVLDFYALEVKNGRLPLPEAQKQALGVIRHLRYEKDDYFWINDLEPRMVMHPFKPELEGKNLADYKDPQGNPIFRAFVEKAKTEGAGYVRYEWPKPGSSKAIPKIS